ncbi:nucleoside recognition domain-containing protein [Sinanaerobacter sp. ZZT-01]|uniref:nucleoside recognition domain-containing protein n=1 Tax=Sinanaerobacter sp. ZZT-01 TaxID=3111540 RepID=UPI002D79F6BD|nr:nucleoside recognition domain-containing protein [Sinanaerobacter sp. ZZT-01]WRR92207.1 nucleoside recognition domain-containing protein [Sinanaerobacter sp. ZZT-01]
MMNYIWVGMLMLGILFAGITGHFSEFSDGLMESCTKAIEFVIGLAGIMAVWSGIMNIGKKTGLMDAAAKITQPFIRLLFPKERNNETIAAILMSFSANIFGAGNSATVFSLQAMTLLDKENRYRERASNAMCMFVVVNMNMVQLIPITVLKIRKDTGSALPESIIVPGIIVGFVTMLLGIFLCKICERKDRE